MQASKFAMAVNLQTAKALGLTAPQSWLLQADEVLSGEDFGRLARYDYTRRPVCG